jgi:hypothetical protein
MAARPGPQARLEDVQTVLTRWGLQLDELGGVDRQLGEPYRG